MQDESRLVFEDDVEEPEEVEEEPEELDDEELVEDLSKLTVAQLKDMLKEKGLRWPRCLVHRMVISSLTRLVNVENSWFPDEHYLEMVDFPHLW